uniref:Uncharacterized protein n=1 Tax=Manihot esculenta TaxID=3983 RepID=A0A2C9UTZ5_MANES
MWKPLLHCHRSISKVIEIGNNIETLNLQNWSLELMSCEIKG